MITTGKNTRINLWVLLPICALLFIYCILRASHIAFTHDEALSYNLVKDGDYFAYTANNHLLNTWLMALSGAVFGESELSLRLPNVLLFLVYLFFCSRLLQKSEKMVFVFFAIPLLFLNPFVIDFFALARGYGLSLGFMAGALYYFLRCNWKEQTFRPFKKDFFLSVVFASLALLSNLSLINFYISLLGLFIGQYVLLFRRGEGRGLKNMSRFLLTCVLAFIPLFFSLKRLMILQEANDLYVGASSFDESVSTFIERSAHFVAYPVWFTEILQSFIIYIFPVGLIITLLRKKYNSPLFKLGLLVLLILIGFWAEHYLFDTLFPIGRTGVYFIPLFGFFIYYLFVQFTENIRTGFERMAAFTGILIVTLPLTIHFFKTINLSHTFEWRYEMHTREVVEILSDQKKTIVLAHNWIFGPSINYYIRSRKLDITSVKIENENYTGDFVYEFQDQLKGENWLPVRLYEDIGSGLYKKP